MRIKIKRHSALADRTRAYVVLLNGEVLGEIKNGEEVEFDVPAGNHQLRLRIDWCRSKAVTFEVDQSPVAFECGSNLRGIKIFLSLLYATIFRDNYMWLRQV